MKLNRIRILFSIMFMIGISFAYSQNLTYSEFMRLSKIERWSEIERFLSAKKFQYAGSIERDDHKTAVWTYNCPDLIFSKEGFDFSYGKNRSLIQIQEYYDGQKCYEFIFPSNDDYNLFLRTAKNNNFYFLKDGIDGDKIFETYKRETKSSTEYLEFIKDNKGFLKVFYEPYF